MRISKEGGGSMKNHIYLKHQEYLVVEIEEYLPRALVDNFLPFTCWSKLRDMKKLGMPNLVDYDYLK